MDSLAERNPQAIGHRNGSKTKRTLVLDRVSRAADMPGKAAEAGQASSVLPLWFKYGFKLLFTVVLVLVVVRSIGWQKILHAIGQADMAMVCAAWMVCLAARSCDAFQLSLVTRRADLSIHAGHVLAASSLAAAYSFVIPGDLAASATKWAYLSAASGKRSVVFSAIVYNRLIGLLPCIGGGAIAAALHNPWNTSLLPLGAAGLVATLFTVFVILYHPHIGLITDHTIRWMARRFLPVWGCRRVQPLLQSLAVLRQFPWRFHAVVLTISCLTTVVLFTAFVMMAWAVGIKVSWLLLAWVWCILVLLRQLPISFHGIGVSEATLVAILGQFGVPEESAFGLGVLGFVNILLFAAGGLVVHVGLTLKSLRWKLSP